MLFLCSETVVNTRHNSGVISLIKKGNMKTLTMINLFVSLWWAIIETYFYYLDEMTKGFNQFEWKIVQQLENCAIFAVVTFLLNWG